MRQERTEERAPGIRFLQFCRPLPLIPGWLLVSHGAQTGWSRLPPAASTHRPPGPLHHTRQGWAKAASTLGPSLISSCLACMLAGRAECWRLQAGCDGAARRCVADRLAGPGLTEQLENTEIAGGSSYSWVSYPALFQICAVAAYQHGAQHSGRKIRAGAQKFCKP